MCGFHDARATVSIERSVLLWCMRLRMVGSRRPLCAQAQIDEALTRLGAPEAVPDFEQFLHVMATDSLRALDIHCVCWRSVGQDELAVLDVLALAQERLAMETLMVLRGLLPPAAAMRARHHAEQVGAALARAGWFLDAPGPALRHFAMGTEAVPGAPHGPACEIHH
jgi:hypothetical protein